MKAAHILKYSIERFAEDCPYLHNRRPIDLDLYRDAVLQDVCGVVVLFKEFPRNVNQVPRVHQGGAILRWVQ